LTSQNQDVQGVPIPSTPTSPWLAVASAAAGLLIAVNILGFAAFFHVAFSGHADFRAYYSTGYLIRTGHRAEIYDYSAQKSTQDADVSKEGLALPYIHPAYEGLLFVPLSLVSYRTAYLLFLFANFGLIAIFVKFQARLGKRGSTPSWLPIVATLAFLPTSVAIMQGQDSILLLVLLCVSQSLLNSGAKKSAGAVLGLASFRFQIAIPLAILFLLWRKWTFVVGFCSTAIILCGISIWLAGVRATETYLRVLLSLRSGTDPLAPQSVSMMPNLRGLIGTLAHGRLNAQIETAVLLVATLAVFALAARGKPSFSWAVLIAVLVSYHVLLHDLCILLIPVLGAMRTFFEGTQPQPKFSRVFLAAAFLLPTALLLFFGGAIYVFAAVLLVFALWGGTSLKDQQAELRAT
jgi:hypothetical protein